MIQDEAHPHVDGFMHVKAADGSGPAATGEAPLGLGKESGKEKHQPT
jgi:hypothetical protein